MSEVQAPYKVKVVRPARKPVPREKRERIDRLLRSLISELEYLNDTNKVLPAKGLEMIEAAYKIAAIFSGVK